MVGGNYCTVCNNGKAEAEAVITAPGHDYENGICGNCGEEDPNAAFAAQIGEKKYLSFAEAYADAKAGDTIVLLADVVADGFVNATGNDTTLMVS